MKMHADFVQVNQEGKRLTDQSRPLIGNYQTTSSQVYSFDFLPQTFRIKCKCQLPGK